jgi:crotonobetainyl-CoA:carnitine CoA-transferase CaiB-like acyl-CoA transferase
MCCGSLAGIRVLECAHYIAGPRCAQLLADHGADVVKLEPPTGDPSRSAQPRHKDISLYFASHNHRKRSIVVDLKSDRGRALLSRLQLWADVMVTNYSPQTSHRLGLDFETASRMNPRLIVVQISAFGVDVEDQGLGGFDGTIQAMSGIADLIGSADGPPTVTAIPIIDHLTAIEGSYAVVLALRQREATGVGQAIDVSMMDVALSILAYAYADVMVRGEIPKRDGSRAPYALTTIYRALDGYVHVAAMTGASWEMMTSLIGRPEWGQPGSKYFDTDVRLRDRATIEAEIEAWSKRYTRQELIAILAQHDIACGPVNRIDEAIKQPLVARRQMVEWVTAGAEHGRIPVPGVELKMGTSRPQEEGRVPALGGDTSAVLAELGLDAAEIATLVSEGVVA